MLKTKIKVLLQAGRLPGNPLCPDSLQTVVHKQLHHETHFYFLLDHNLIFTDNQKYAKARIGGPVQDFAPLM